MPRAKSTNPKKQGLTPKQGRFVDEYLIDLNATRAYIRAYGGTEQAARAHGARLVANGRVSAAISQAQSERSDRTKVTADRVLEELARLGFSDMREFVQWGPEGVRLLASGTLDDNAARCVAEVSQTVSEGGGSIKFKLHDKASALMNIGKHLGMFTDKVEVTGKDGKPLVSQVWIVGGKEIRF